MKKLLVLLVSLISIGCVSSQGTYSNALMKRKGPYEFSYKGSAADAIKALKRALMAEGFVTESDEQEAGIYATKYRELNDDEKFDIGLAAAFAGVSVQTQQGRIGVLYEQKQPDYVSLNISFYLSVMTETTSGNLRGSQNKKEQEVTQGHPMAIKFGRLISKLPGFSLNYPLELPPEKQSK